MIRRRLLLVWAIATLTLCACGPTLPIKAGLQDAGANVFFGEPYETSPPPVPAAANPLPSFPAPLEPAPQPLPPPLAPPPCPAAPPTAGPLEPAPVVPTSGPRPASYVYRVSGSETLNGKRLPLPSAETRAVGSVQRITDRATGNTHWQFSVAETLGRQTTTMTYDLEPSGPTGALGGAASPAAGLYLLQITDSSGDTFTPSSGIQIMPFPAAAGAAYPSAGWAQGSGVDAVHDEAMQILSGGIPGRGRVNACGTVLDSWTVEITGTIGDARSAQCPAGGCGSQKSFDLTFYCGTGFGGLILGDHLVENGTDATTGGKFAYDITALIDSVPEAGP